MCPSQSPLPPSEPARAKSLVETIGFTFWLVAAVLLMVGGMIAASVSLPGLDTPVFRGVGVLIAVAGAGMAFLAGRSRSGDPRFRRAAIALSVAIVVIVALTARLGVVHILTLIGIVLLIIGTILNALPRRDRD
ncbi:hypothetical protein [Mycolicibacterium goodii]|uniref:Integral membrane protein n=1 Tax=Mycolicibacterium goodii TaxID=134601 RepID=A0ABS6HZC7_MYCGD|nr:hypothetical protein [Mycolicibacterium goodii]OKH64979.1 hypothetical protein EB74_08180 [Mycobacterium sp. SWH-M5]MBU8819239.1 hypothetical protein [Mycolicibacterium goodii]MBU8826703.1 hypothetical protein [Mycolicibacterium goodii]MBU8833007.1 hypothetical protein [Mycolicibacterium goodii]MBU8837134.1 hypothetical protein [Mycolicibacterium goodii]